MGAVSPARHLLDLATGVVRLADRSSQLGLDYLMVDPPGFLDYPAGHAFRLRLIPEVVPLHGHVPAREEEWPGRLVGLVDRDGFLLRLGVAQDRQGRRLRVSVPPVDLEAVSR